MSSEVVGRICNYVSISISRFNFFDAVSGNVGDAFYDHVLPVEMDTPRGVQSLKLGYNDGENPFVAAQRFIEQNQLGQHYLGEIADWIMARFRQIVFSSQDTFYIYNNSIYFY